MDLDSDGAVLGPQDAFGYGQFEGQYGMALLSRYPILEGGVRTFQKLLWSAVPDALRPAGYYPDEVWQRLRLSSKSHWDVPVGIGTREDGYVVHALCSHPTPPSFDGSEDRNGCRNHDEVRFWVDYLSPDLSGWIVDDQGGRGGLAPGESFVVLGDLNCDPVDGDSRREALLALLAHPRVQDAEPKSLGGPEQKLKQFGVNMQHQGEPGLDTGDDEALLERLDRMFSNDRSDVVAVGECGLDYTLEVPRGRHDGVASEGDGAEAEPAGAGVGGAVVPRELELVPQLPLLGAQRRVAHATRRLPRHGLVVPREKAIQPKS